MAIVRLIVVDQRPVPEGKSDLLVYQIPEHSREMSLLQEVFSAAGLEWTVIESLPRPAKKLESV